MEMKKILSVISVNHLHLQADALRDRGFLRTEQTYRLDL